MLDHAIYTFSVSRQIPASAERVYKFLADYRKGHPKILPKEFSDFEVEKGGVGAGTVIRFTLETCGKKQTLRAAVSEPEPGRRLVETALDDQGFVTSFTVEPGSAENECLVTVSTDIEIASGLLGKAEGFMVRSVLKPVYKKELLSLEKVIQSDS